MFRDENTGGIVEDGKLNGMLVQSRENPDVWYQFELTAESEEDTLDKLEFVINEIVHQIGDKTVEGIDGDDEDIMRSVIDAINHIRKARNRIVIPMIAGDALYLDGESIDWDDRIAHMDALQNALDNVRRLIRDVLTKETVSFADDKTGESKEVNTIELAKAQIQKFHENNKSTPDYSIFDGKISERELIVIQLTDIMSIYMTIGSIASTIESQKAIVQAYETRSNITQTKGAES
jgi:hypothetical protein